MPRIRQPDTQLIVSNVILGIWMTGKPVIATNREYEPVGLLHLDRTTPTGLRFERRNDAIAAAFGREA